MPNSWRTKRACTPDFHQKEFPVCPPTKFFDQLSFIGDEFVGCFLLETQKGLVLFDCMNPDERSVSIIESGMAKLGRDVRDLYAIVISHGHGDHFGRADYFQRKYGAKIAMSQMDYESAKEARPNAQWEPVAFSVDHFLQDGETLDFGDTEVQAVFTPGHTRGCFSFVLPVTDEARPHRLALWGGAGIMPDSNVDDYLRSWEKFHQICRQCHVDGEISTHPFLDMGISRLALVRNITDGVPNPFVLGEEGYQYYEKMFYDYALTYLPNQ